jgi:hypothetical protein
MCWISLLKGQARVVANCSPAGRRRRHVGQRRPGRDFRLEPLEDRCVMASLLWVGNGAPPLLWSTGANWANTANGKAAVPANGDTLIFDTTHSVGGINGSGANNTNDIAGLTLASLQVSNYGGTITLNNSLVVTDDSVISSGTITGNSLSVSPPIGGSPTLTLNGGVIDVPLQLGPDVTTALDPGGPAFLTLGKDVTNAGDVEWLTGNINLGGVFSNMAGGSFDIRCNRMLNAMAGTSPGLVNAGTMTKVVGNLTSQTTIGVPFVNTGTFSIDNGQVVLSAAALQQGAGSMTYIKGNGVLNAIYDMYDGGLYGTGLFEGTLNNGTPFGATGGVVHPGLAAGQPGTLTINGVYNQGAVGKLYIDLFNDTTCGLLNVIGTANLDGTLYWVRHPDFKPESGSFNFLTGTIVGDFASEVSVNESWRGPNGTFRLSSERVGNVYRLVVEPPKAGGP